MRITGKIAKIRTRKRFVPQGISKSFVMSLQVSHFVCLFFFSSRRLLPQIVDRGAGDFRIQNVRDIFIGVGVGKSPYDLVKIKLGVVSGVTSATEWESEESVEYSVRRQKEKFLWSL